MGEVHKLFDIEMANGMLVIKGNLYDHEPICAICHHPIPWVLDMMSFVGKGGDVYVACHSRCAHDKYSFRDQLKAQSKENRIKHDNVQ